MVQRESTFINPHVGMRNNEFTFMLYNRNPYIFNAQCMRPMTHNTYNNYSMILWKIIMNENK